jgi:hypothetical protein
MISLPIDASQPLQMVSLAGGFDTLGYDPESEVLPQP